MLLVQVLKVAQVRKLGTLTLRRANACCNLMQFRLENLNLIFFSESKRQLETSARQFAKVKMPVKKGAAPKRKVCMPENSLTPLWENNLI